jgi:hypothetical protein
VQKGGHLRLRVFVTRASKPDNSLWDIKNIYLSTQNSKNGIICQILFVAYLGGNWMVLMGVVQGLYEAREV